PALELGEVKEHGNAQRLVAAFSLCESALEQRARMREIVRPFEQGAPEHHWMEAAALIVESCRDLAFSQVGRHRASVGAHWSEVALRHPLRPPRERDERLISTCLGSSVSRALCSSASLVFPRCRRIVIRSRSKV